MTLDNEQPAFLFNLDMECDDCGETIGVGKDCEQCQAFAALDSDDCDCHGPMRTTPAPDGSLQHAVGCPARRCPTCRRVRDVKPWEPGGECSDEFHFGPRQFYEATDLCECGVTVPHHDDCPLSTPTAMPRWVTRLYLWFDALSVKHPAVWRIGRRTGDK